MAADREYGYVSSSPSRSINSYFPEIAQLTTLLLAVDSVGIVSEDMWVRGSGFEESWQKFRPRT